MTNTFEPTSASISPEVNQAIDSLLAALGRQVLRQPLPETRSAISAEEQRTMVGRVIQNLRKQVKDETEHFADTARPAELLFLLDVMNNWGSFSTGWDDTGIIAACGYALHGVPHALLMNDEEQKVLPHLQKILAEDDWLSRFLAMLTEERTKRGPEGFTPAIAMCLLEIHREQFDSNLEHARDMLSKYPGLVQKGQ
jgi:hypothetical protein